VHTCTNTRHMSRLILTSSSLRRRSPTSITCVVASRDAACTAPVRREIGKGRGAAMAGARKLRHRAGPKLRRRPRGVPRRHGSVGRGRSHSSHQRSNYFSYRRDKFLDLLLACCWRALCSCSYSSGLDRVHLLFCQDVLALVVHLVDSRWKL
jgi:hypothetical protein